MLASKHINKIIAALVAVTVVLCFAAMLFSENLIKAFGDSGVNMEYESKLFNTDEIMNVDIIMDDEKWQEMLDNPMSEEYYQCDVKINGETFYNVGIRPKGNTSLSSIAMDETTNRYSFKLEFDQFVAGQTCYGLDKLVLNNNYADATNMKEALIYDMFNYIDADSSLYSYAKICVNGEHWGVYTALEAVEDSFLLRSYGVKSGELYKPETMGMGGGDNKGGGIPTPPDMNNSDSDSRPTPPENGGNMPDMGKDFDPSQFDGEMPDMGDFDFSEMGGGFSMGGGGANLNYSDDDLDSYSTIWEGEVGNTGKNDHKRVVKALKNISEGTNLEKYMDIDNLLKYMAVHVFSVNEDSLSGMMSHNYYLYEDEGRLNIIPWDYNLALGGMNMGMGSSNGATSTINDPIDNAFSGTKFFDTLMDNEEYHDKYYEYMQKLVDGYLLGGGFEKFYNRVRSQIDELVETDPNAFFTYDEYITAAETLCEVVKLRTESISGQLNGTIPSTSSEQRNSDALIDASDIDLTVMGVMNMGGGGFDKESASEDFDPNSFGDSNFKQTKLESSEPTSGGITLTNLANFDGQAPPDGFDPSNMPDDFDPSQFGGNPPDGFDPSNMPEGAEPPKMNGEKPTAPETTQADDNSETEETTVTSSDEKSDGKKDGSFEKPDGKDFKEKPDNMPSFGGNSGTDSGSALKSNLILYGICFIIMAAALIFVKLYHRRNRR